MDVVDDAVVGRVDVDPAPGLVRPALAAPERNPGVRGVGADQARPAGRRRGQDVAADVPGGEADRAQAADHQVGEVLADAALVLQHFAQRRGDARCGAVELEVLVDALREVGRGLEDAAPGGEALHRIVGEVLGALDVRRLEGELRHFGNGRAVDRVQPGAHRLPGGLRPGQRGARTGLDGDLRLGAHQEVPVRRGDDEVHDAIAEVILALRELGRKRVDLDAVQLATLPGEHAWREVQQLLRQRDRARVAVLGLVKDVQAHGAVDRG